MQLEERRYTHQEQITNMMYNFEGRGAIFKHDNLNLGFIFMRNRRSVYN